VQPPVKVLFNTRAGADLQRVTAVKATGDVRRVPLSVVQGQLVEPRPHPGRRGVDEDGMAQGNHSAKATSLEWAVTREMLTAS
jgi:hypothetical protein